MMVMEGITAVTWKGAFGVRLRSSRTASDKKSTGMVGVRNKCFRKMEAKIGNDQQQQATCHHAPECSRLDSGNWKAKTHILSFWLHEMKLPAAPPILREARQIRCRVP